MDDHGGCIVARVDLHPASGCLQEGEKNMAVFVVRPRCSHLAELITEVTP